MVSNEEASKSLTPEERLKALLFQFLKLYERWSEDRQTFNNNMANHEAMLKDFSEKINQFEQLEPQVRDKLIDAIGRASRVLSEDIKEKIGRSATEAVNQTARELKTVVSDVSRALTQYKQQIQISQAKGIVITVCTAVFTSLLIVWFLIPKPILPLTGNMLHSYADGVTIENLWPKLPRKIQIQIDKASRENFGENHPFGEVSQDKNSNSEDLSNDSVTGGG